MSMATASEAPPISSWTLRFFTHVVRRYFRKHFRSVLVQHGQRLQHTKGPLIVYLNHSSWWDPMVGVLLARTLLPERNHYAPMDAAELKRYAILRKVGLFPVETGTARGAAQFLHGSQRVLRDGGVLWVTPQGRFADVRESPLAFKEGLAALIVRMGGATVVPLAIEYTFWDERLPEVLVRFGEPAYLEACGTAELTHKLEAALAAEMLELQKSSLARDSRMFEVLLTGGRGTGGFYSIGMRLRAIFAGKKDDLDHTARAENGTAARPRCE
jgi:1-acyl-sn-glycerol-3-phosphate acyltransferase